MTTDSSLERENTSWSFGDVWDTSAATVIPETVPLYGHLFDVIHITAIVCTATSLVFSTGLMAHILRQPKAFRKQPIAVRMAFYLAICDLGFYGSHCADHIYILAHRKHPPWIACIFAGFMLYQFAMSQCMVVLLTALNGFLQIVMQKRVDCGDGDWKLLVLTFGVPGVVNVIGASLEWFGPEDMMCGIDKRKPGGSLLDFCGTVATLVTLIACVVCYLGIWLHMKHTAKKITPEGTIGTSKYRRTGVILFTFVISFVLQWWSYLVYKAWVWVGDPAFSIRLCLVVFANMGGVFNFLAYTFVRTRLIKTEADLKTQRSIKTAN